MKFIIPEQEVRVRSIGAKFIINRTVTVKHDREGNEEETLIMLYDHCKKNIGDTVIYIHNKGSFHPSRRNDELRRFDTYGALSRECSMMPDYCNICASRMSPFPHPHTSGNMWAAKCDYIEKLLNPREFGMRINKIYKIRKNHECDPVGRFSVEGWAYSHPSAFPCDLSNSSFVWSYDGIPSIPFTIDLQPAPRFAYAKYEKKYCSTPSLGKRINEYKLLFKESPDEKWWGWKIYNTTMKNITQQ